MNLQASQQQFAHNAANLINYVYAMGYSCTFGEAWRSAEQAAIYAKEGKGIADSLHCKRLALDLNIFDKAGKFLTRSEEYKDFGVHWEGLNAHNRWGGRFVQRPDGNHFEMEAPQ